MAHSLAVASDERSEVFQGSVQEAHPFTMFIHDLDETRGRYTFKPEDNSNIQCTSAVQMGAGHNHRDMNRLTECKVWQIDFTVYLLWEQERQFGK